MMIMRGRHRIANSRDAVVASGTGNQGRIHTGIGRDPHDQEAPQPHGAGAPTRVTHCRLSGRSGFIASTSRGRVIREGAAPVGSLEHLVTRHLLALKGLEVVYFRFEIHFEGSFIVNTQRIDPI